MTAQTKKTPQILSKSWGVQVENAPIDDLLNIWLPQVCAKFNDAAYHAVWISIRSHIEEATSTKTARKYISDVRRALKVHGQNLDEHAWQRVAYRALQDVDYGLALDAFRGMLRQNPEALNNWCQLEPPHMQLLAHSATHNIHGKIAPLANVVVGNLNAANRTKLRNELATNSSALYWKNLNTQTPNFQRLDAVLDVLSFKINSVFKTINVYSMAEIYKPDFPKHSSYSSWKKHIETRFDDGSVFGDLFESSIYVSRIQGGLRSSLHCLHEAHVAGHLGFLCKHVDRLDAEQCKIVLETAQTMAAHGVDLVHIDVLGLKSRVEKDALQSELSSLSEARLPSKLKKI